MPKITHDGAVITAALNPKTRKNPLSNKMSNHNIYKVRMDKVHFTDDKKNITKASKHPEVVYTATVVGGPMNGMRIFNVRKMVEMGGKNNSSEEILSPVKNKPLTARPAGEVKPSETDGDYGYVSFINGNWDSPIYMGGSPHPESEKGATKEDGIRKRRTMNGFSQSINKDGEFVLEFGGGPKDKDGNHKYEDAKGTKITFAKNGHFTLEDNSGSKLTLSRSDGGVAIESNGSTSHKSKGSYAIQSDGSGSLDMSGALALNGSSVSIAGGGAQSVRVGDITMGTCPDHGSQVISTCMTGSGAVLVGG